MCTDSLSQNEHKVSVASPVADALFNYLSDVIYNPANAALDIESLPEDFRDFGSGLRYFAELVMETKVMAQALAKGDLTGKIPSPDNEIASPLKALQASLKHLTWQTQQIAQGDYQQRVKFMGDFAVAFNSMAKQLEERSTIAIREKSTLLRYVDLILSNTPNILLVFDNNGKAVLASKAYLKHGKKSSMDEIQGKTFTELFEPLSTNGFLQNMNDLFHAALSNIHTDEIEQSIDFGQDGNLRTYTINVTPMLCEEEGVLGTMVLFHDVTEMLQAKYESERARELAEQSAQAKSDFLARMTHEIRTPMNAIIGMTSIGKAAQDIEKKDYSFQQIEVASTHLLGVINDILDISKNEADRFELSCSDFNFKCMISNVKSIIGIQVTEKEQLFITDIDNDIPVNIISDEQRLMQVLVNLLSNAVKFTPTQGTIGLTAKKITENDGICTIRFTIKDTGIGISKEQQARLFTPFEQADGSIHRKYGGTGLGLAISKRIVEKMGGDIWIESELGKGASFIFDIKAENGNGAAEQTDKAKTVETGIFRGKRIMIAEDIDINREIISAILEDTGLEIDFAVNGAEAVEKCLSDANDYDLILMDIQMPEMDGYEATRRIRRAALPKLVSIPIIAMTANVFKEDVERCIAAGMNAHLGKPIDIPELMAKLEEYLL